MTGRNYDLHFSTLNYHKMRHHALVVISGYQRPRCENCGNFGEGVELQVHHVDPEKGNGSEYGGTQQIYELEKQYVNGVELEVVCHTCHKQIHDVDEDQRYLGHAGDEGEIEWE